MQWVGQCTWQDQYFRMHRCLESVPRSVWRDDIPSLYDAWNVFFTEVSNMRDWLQKDPNTSHECCDVKREIAECDKYKRIRMCVDLGNQAKHFTPLPNRARILGAIGSQSGLTESQLLSYQKEPVTTSTQDAAETYTGVCISDPEASARYDGWEVACKALEEWDQYLKDHCIEPPAVFD